MPLKIDVTGVGANSIDQVLRIPAAIQSVASSGKVRVGSQHWFCGGQTATTMSACAALGLRVRYIGAFGSDEHGGRMRAELAGRGIDISHTVVCDAANAGAVIVVDHAGHRTVFWNRDERLSLVPEQIPAAALSESRVIHVDDVDRPAALRACVRY
jgi:sugar/nucleoside kinase (ribokinase family)